MGILYKLSLVRAGNSVFWPTGKRGLFYLQHSGGTLMQNWRNQDFIPAVMQLL